jgi:hypothetical protein
MRAYLLVFSLSLLSATAFAHPLVYGDPDGGTPPSTIDEVCARMDTVAGTLPADDGIVQFNQLYRKTTDNMAAGIAAGRFLDGPFMADFTVGFARMYFDALSEEFSGETPPKAWNALFTRRSRTASYQPVEFALAGMEAHISHDLPIFLASDFASLEAYPAVDSARARDFFEVNQILAETFSELRDQLLSGPAWFRVIGDETAMPWIRLLRANAWEDGQLIWNLRNLPTEKNLYLGWLDVSTGVESAGAFAVKP